VNLLRERAGARDAPSWLDAFDDEILPWHEEEDEDVTIDP
jgi:hypothetical protein